MNWTYVLLAFAGVVASMIIKLIDVKTLKGNPDVRKNILFSLGGFILLSALIITSESGTVLGYTLTSETVVLMGFFVDTLVKSVTKFNPYKNANK